MDHFFLSIYKVYCIITLYTLIPFVLYFFAGNEKTIKTSNNKVNYSKQLYILHLFKFILGTAVYIGTYNTTSNVRLFDILFCLCITFMWFYINKLCIRVRNLINNNTND